MFGATKFVLSGAIAAGLLQAAPGEVWAGEVSGPVGAQNPPAQLGDSANSYQSALRQAQDKSFFLGDGPGGSAGYDNGFYIKQNDFSLRPSFHIQFRHVTDYRKDAKNDGGSDIQNGFEIRRLRPEFEGTLFSPDLAYLIQLDVNRVGGGVGLLDAWAKYRLADGWYVRVGQFKAAQTHEELVSDKRGLAAERSLQNELIGGGLVGRVQGISLIYGGYDKDKPLNAELTYHDGDRTLNTDFTDAGRNFGLAGRVEFQVVGDWKDYRDFSAKGLTKDLLVLGAAIDVSQGDNFTQYLPAIDLQWKNPGGFAVYAVGLAQIYNHRNGATEDSVTNWGVLVQGAYLVNAGFEIFGRYGLTKFEDDLATGQDTVHEITLGGNFFLFESAKAFHRAKFTIDATLLPNGAPAATGAGVTGGTDTTELVIRGQFQLII
jgi:hypothetical protein